MTPLKPGRLAPEFDLETDTGERLSLSSLRGQNVVLYFYPKDDTTGCTQEACEFRDLFPRFKKSKAVILGVSRGVWPVFDPRSTSIRPAFDQHFARI